MFSTAAGARRWTDARVKNGELRKNMPAGRGRCARPAELVKKVFLTSSQTRPTSLGSRLKRLRLAAAHSLRSHVCEPSLPSTGRKTCGSAGRKCPHTTSKPLRIHKVFSAAFSLSASISAPAELLRIGQPWIFEGFLFFWTQAGCRPPRRKGQKALKRLAVRRMGFLPVDGLFSPTYTPPAKML